MLPFHHSDTEPAALIPALMELCGATISCLKSSAGFQVTSACNYQTGAISE